MRLILYRCPPGGNWGDAFHVSRLPFHVSWIQLRHVSPIRGSGQVGKATRGSLPPGLENSPVTIVVATGFATRQLSTFYKWPLPLVVKRGHW